VALSALSGDTVQSYQYSVYGQVAASDPNFTANPYLFTGRRFDYETGLYYYRARYYNPYIGRFLQTDPVGYADGINWYAYCGNNPVGMVDPSGLVAIAFYDGTEILQPVSELLGIYRNEGLELLEMADDFWHFDYQDGEEMDMLGPEYVLWVLEQCKKTWDLDVTEIYFFGHGGSTITGTTSIGTSSVGTGSKPDDDFWKALAEAVPDAVINLRTCDSATPDESNNILITEIARITGLTVTGITARAWSTMPWWINNPTGYWSPQRWEGTGPDYELDYGGGYYRAEVQEDGTVETTCYWRNIQVVETNEWGNHMWYNPWGPQPR
jgi:RHS repeat-associated protein